LPEHAERLWGLGEALRRQNKFDDAALAYTAALVQRPALGEAELGLTLVFAARGDYPRALEHARRHAAINPGATVAWRNVSDMALGAGDTDAAVAAAERWIELAPADREAHDSRWQAFFAAGRRQEAIVALRASRQALPGDWNVLSTLAWMLAVTPGEPPASAREALELATEAARLNPAHPRSYDVLAAAQAAAGDFDQAVRSAEHALRLAAAPAAAPMRSAIQARLALYQSRRPYVQAARP
jgi:tetratricopeptide (TPR) repeat protein